jgi:hypothetical protein
MADFASSPGAGVPLALTAPVTATLVRMRGADEACGRLRQRRGLSPPSVNQP